MKIIVTMLFTFIAISAFAMKNDSKTFNERVKKEVERQVDMIKKKSIAQLAKELLEKERSLNKRQDELDLREEQVVKSEGSLLKNINNLEARKKKIIGCLDKNKRNEQIRINQLVNVISGMRPQKAAEILSVQESNISVKILEKIDPTKASKIFNVMDKEVSARLQKQYLNMQQ